MHILTSGRNTHHLMSHTAQGRLAYVSASVATMAKSTARFTPFARGRIVGKAEEGASRRKICSEVFKKDGKRATLRAVGGVLNHAKADPKWQGENSSAGGRPRMCFYMWCISHTRRLGQGGYPSPRYVVSPRH